MGALPQTSSISRPLVATLPLAYARKRLTPVAFRQPPATSRLMSEMLFLDALDRERARADRFEEPFVVARVRPEGISADANDWDRIVEALWPATEPGDLVGWIETGRVMGVIRSGASNLPGLDRGRATARTMRADLIRRLPSGLSRGAVHVDVYHPAHATRPGWLCTGMTRRRSARVVARAAAKRAIDVIGSLIMLVLLAPLMATVALLVKVTSPGPIFFRQVRVGYKGQLFTMYKFRTIRADADVTLHRRYVKTFIKAGANKPEGGGGTCKIVNDPRVTCVGRFLRQSSIDEVPQFWNVLLGEMSLVGPRPALPYEVACYKAWHQRRMYEAKPGMTGLWQISGRSRTSFDEMVRLDLRYARNCTIVTDLRILLATPRVVLSGRGAH